MGRSSRLAHYHQVCRLLQCNRFRNRHSIPGIDRNLGIARLEGPQLTFRCRICLRFDCHILLVHRRPLLLLLLLHHHLHLLLLLHLQIHHHLRLLHPIRQWIHFLLRPWLPWLHHPDLLERHYYPKNHPLKTLKHRIQGCRKLYFRYLNPLTIFILFHVKAFLFLPELFIRVFYSSMKKVKLLMILGT